MKRRNKRAEQSKARANKESLNCGSSTHLALHLLLFIGPTAGHTTSARHTFTATFLMVQHTAQQPKEPKLAALHCQLFSSHCWNHPQKAFATIREAVERESIGHPSRSATPKASGTAFPSANALPSPFPSGASATHPVGLHTAAFHLQCFPTTPHDPPVNRAHFFTSHILTSIPTPHPSPTAHIPMQTPVPHP